MSAFSYKNTFRSIEMGGESRLTVSEDADWEDVRDARVAVNQHHRV